MMMRALDHVRRNVIGYLALFVALSGTAYAASEIGKNAVRSKQIKNGQVKSKDLGKDAVDASKVKNASLLGEDFAAGQLPQGPAGLDATNLFAFILDTGNAQAATVGYGAGVTGVTDPAAAGDYLVAFNRNLDNCVVQATAGFGQPPTSGAVGVPSFPFVNVSAGTDQEARVAFQNAAGNPTDTSFLVTAFC